MCDVRSMSSSPGMGEILSSVYRRPGDVNDCDRDCGESGEGGPFSFVGESIRYEEPPHGGLRNTTSIDGLLTPLHPYVLAKEHKSPKMNSIRSSTPYTIALCRARASLKGELSMAITKPPPRQSLHQSRAEH